MIKKILPWLIAILYGVFPYDLVPDFFVGPGWLDDLVVLGLVYWWVSRQRKAYATRGTSSAGTEKTEEPPPRTDRTQEEDPYEILGLQPGASVAEIRAAHKRLAAQYHPDKVQHLGEEFQQLAHERFVAIQKAYDSLTK